VLPPTFSPWRRCSRCWCPQCLLTAMQRLLSAPRPLPLQHAAFSRRRGQVQPALAAAVGAASTAFTAPTALALLAPAARAASEADPTRARARGWPRMAQQPLCRRLNARAPSTQMSGLTTVHASGGGGCGDTTTDFVAAAMTGALAPTVGATLLSSLEALTKSHQAQRERIEAERGRAADAAARADRAEAAAARAEAEVRAAGAARSAAEARAADLERAAAEAVENRAEAEARAAASERTLTEARVAATAQRQRGDDAAAQADVLRSQVAELQTRLSLVQEERNAAQQAALSLQATLAHAESFLASRAAEL